MQKKLLRLCSLVLTIAMLCNMLPLTTLAASAGSQDESTAPLQAASEAHVVAELPEERTAYTKTFRLSNGLNMAAVYNDPVHYEKDGKWAEIDNTLKLAGTDTNAVLTNTAGLWDVQFPQQLSGSKAVSITKDGYTLSFFMAGQLRDSGHVLQTAPMGSTQAETFAIGSEVFGIQAISTSEAKIEKTDITDKRSQAQYPEIVLEKNHSRLAYSGVYANTDLVYDLASNRVKESIVIGAYDATLRGYRYTLNVGNMVPVLTDTNEILLFDERRENVILSMPAPYLEDANGAFSDDIGVTLTGSDNTWTLAYTLPRSWMAAEDRVYPVVLDPIVETPATPSNIQDVSVYQRNAQPYTNAALDVGRHTTYGLMRTYIKFNSLPVLSPGDVVVDASLSLYFLSNSGSAVPICVHGVHHDWAEDDLVWDVNDPDWDKDHPYDHTVTDYNSLQYKGTYEWDVTEIVRYWYDVANYGLMLKLPDTWEADINNFNIRHQFGAKNYSVYDLPTITVIYRSVIGIESYYNYATLSAGNAGGVYIADSTGQVTVTRTVGSYASNVNPFSLNLVYNSIHFAKANPEAYHPATEMGLAMELGSGWSLDAIQKVESITVGQDTYLKYWDGDGTVHYFYEHEDDGYYCDEDGLGLEIVPSNDGSYTMSDDMDNQWFYTYAGTDGSGRFLTSTKDNNGNGFELQYSNQKLTSIRQKNGSQITTVATLTYNDNRVTTITDASGGEYHLDYDSSNVLLTKISYGTNNLAEYSYTSHRITRLKDAQRGYSLELGYYETNDNDSGKKRWQVSHYMEKGGSTEGAYYAIYYYGATQTVYHYYGENRKTKDADNPEATKVYAEDDLYTYCMTDYWGRLVNAYTTDHTQMNILGASTTLPTQKIDIEKTNNRTIRTASIGVAAQKLLTQGGFESISDVWTHSGTSASQSKPRTGLYSLKGTTTSSSATVQASKTSMTLEPGTYTLSAYVNTSSVTAFAGSTPGVRLQVPLGDKTPTSERVDYATNQTIDNGWVRIAVTFTVDSARTVSAQIVGTGMVGTFYVDDVQLEKSEGPSAYNLLENGDFQVGSSHVNWTVNEKGVLATGVGVGVSREDIVAQTYPGAKAMSFTNTIQEEYALVYQVVPINKAGAQSYVLSGWAMADAVPDTLTSRYDPAIDHQKQFGLRAIVNYSNGTQDYFYVPFNTDITGWQYASLAVKPTSTTKTVSTITVYCCYETNANTAWFDNISLVEAAVNIYKYDDNGNPINSDTTWLNGQTVTYDSNGNVKTVVQKTGSGSSDKITTTYTYDSSFVHRVTSVNNGVTTQTMAYDTYGNVNSTTLKGSNTKSIVSSTTYTGNGNRAATVTDSAGNTVTCAYSTGGMFEMLGQPSSVTDPKGTKTEYSLDSLGRVSEVEVLNSQLANLASLAYTYSSGMLSELTRTAGNVNQAYSFEYDDFGNSKKIYIGTSENTDNEIYLLAEYTYAEANGLLQSQTYGNGDSVTFTYDILGRVKTASYTGNRVLTYAYTGDGQLYSVHDSKTGYTYKYTYDSLGRLMSSAVSNASGVILSTRQTYDSNNQLSGQHWRIETTNYSESYTYSKTTGLLATHKPAVGNTLSYTYDALQRLSTVTGGIYGKTYTYRDISSTNTTTQVAGLTYDLPTDIVFGYEYDDLGNVEKYTESGNEYVYSYDAQNQLTTVKTNGTVTYEYEYDAAGNITEATTPTGTHTYTYDTGVWKDLLKSFDGGEITYDASGNPTSYYNGTRWNMTWAEGRRLVSASGDGKSLTFTYDSDGLRLTKKVGNTTYQYYYAGGKLLRQTGGGNTLDFFYDTSGNPYALKYNNTLYYYITNLQGDVLKIVDTSGNPVVTYSYDPYGKLLSGTDSTLGNLNPLRYRGYVYDTETSLYYVSSRYYDPEVGRWINADSLVSTGQGIISNNMFAYCLNNPVNKIDDTGKSAVSAVPQDIASLITLILALLDSGTPFLEILMLVSAVLTVEETRELVKAWALSVESETEKRTHHVYVLIDPKHEDTIKYVGRTNNPARRMYEHTHDPSHPERKNYQMVVLVSGLTKNEAVVIEQILISTFTLGNLENARREIGNGNLEKYRQYLGAAKEIIQGATEISLFELMGE